MWSVETPSLLKWNQLIVPFQLKSESMIDHTQKKVVDVLIEQLKNFFEAKCSSFDPKIFQGLDIIERRLSVKTVLENIFYCLRNFDSTIPHD